MAKVLLSYNMDRTRPGYPLWAWYDWYAEMVRFEGHTSGGVETWVEDGINTPRALWDAMMDAKRLWEDKHPKEGKHDTRDDD